MQNITFSVEKEVIEAARQKARSERTTLNEEFRRWIKTYANQEDSAARAMEFLKGLRASGVGSGGRKFTREEMNER